MPGPPYQQMPIHDDNGKFPWWVRAISFVGIPGVLVLGGALWMTNTVDTKITSIETTLKLHQIDAAYNVKANEDQNRINVQQNVHLQAMFQLLQQICVNTARTASDRATCWTPWR